MITNWNQIEAQAKQFSKNWKSINRSGNNSLNFSIDFFKIYGIPPDQVVSFEEMFLDNNEFGFLWKGVALFKTTNDKTLENSFIQAKNHLYTLTQNEIPSYIIVTNFSYFLIYNVQNQSENEFGIKDLHLNVGDLKGIIGFPEKNEIGIDFVDKKAIHLVEQLYLNIKKNGVDDFSAEQFMLELLYCLFAEDSGIFKKQQFQNYIENEINKDGSNLINKLQYLFQILQTPIEFRPEDTTSVLKKFQYCTDEFFKIPLEITASLDSKTYNLLLDCCYLNWGNTAPSNLGFLLQNNIKARKGSNNITFHASELNVLKLINPLFMDDLRIEFNTIKKNTDKVLAFHTKLVNLNFLDPACGLGNFMAIAYRELRLLELEVLQVLKSDGVEIEKLQLVAKNQFFGIEIDSYSAKIAQLTLIAMEQKLNLDFSLVLKTNFIPTKQTSSNTIHNQDPLEFDWEQVISKNKLSFIFGSPPLIGSKIMSAKQRDTMAKVFNNTKGSGILDYVSGWFIVAAKYIQNTKIKAAFVATNSIVQGEQISVLWHQLLNLYNIKIHFAHKNLNWFTQQNGSANFCVIIGFANIETPIKRLFEYNLALDITTEKQVANINPYLIAANNLMINKSFYPICNVPEMTFGNMPLDGGHLLLSDDEKIDLIFKQPTAEKFIFPIISAHEFLNGKNRWCLWLVNASKSDIKSFPEIQKRVDLVKQFRQNSKRIQTIGKANKPSLFSEVRDFGKHFIVIPKVTSESRKYIPIGYFDKNYIVSDTCISIPNGNLYHFGILTSGIHMTWVKTVCGRLKSDFRYSKEIVYNNFPWPENPCQEVMEHIEQAAKKILDIRNHYSNNSLADLYSQNMPTDLANAHKALDEIVEKAYCKNSLPDEETKIEFLFNLYEKYNNSVSSTLKNKPRKRISFGVIQGSK